MVNAVYPGPLSEAEALLQPLISAGPSLTNVTAVPWKSLVSSAFFGAEPANSTCGKGLVQNVFGGGIKTYHIPTLQQYIYDLNGFFMAYPSTRGTVFFIEHFPWQAVRAISDDETAYPHRDFTAHLYVSLPAQHLELPFSPPSISRPKNAFVVLCLSSEKNHRLRSVRLV